MSDMVGYQKGSQASHMLELLLLVGQKTTGSARGYLPSLFAFVLNE